MSRFSPLLFLLAACCLSGCGHLVQGKAEDAVNAILPDYLGPAEKYSTKVDASSGAILRGHLTRVRIEGQKVQLTPDLLADTLDLELNEVNVDTRTKQVKSIESVRFVVAVGDSNLNRYVKKLRPDLRDLRVSSSDTGFTIHVRPELFSYPTVPIDVTGGLNPTSSGDKLNFDPTGARVSIVPVAGAIMSWLLRSVNPAVDLTGMKVPVQVTRVETGAQRLYITGTVRPEDLLKAQSKP